jgi:hypothetical protein
MAVTARRPIGVPLPLRSDDLVDLGLHQLVHDPQADADAQRQQPLPRRPDELTESFLNLRRKRTL